jgi:hypothetical protein
MREEDGVENQNNKGHRSLWEMLEGPVRDIVWAEGLPELEIPDGLPDFLRIG